MSNFCPNCGSQLPEGATFCGNCGKSVGAAPGAGAQQPQYSGPRPTVTKKELVMAIILSIVTCGIYSIIWFINITDDANKVSNDFGTSGGMAFLFTLITCGIYGFYWYYKVGKQLYNAGRAYGVDISDNSILYLILGLFGLGIVNYALIQTDLNKFAA